MDGEGDNDEDDVNSLFGSEEGEGMVGFDIGRRQQNHAPDLGRGAEIRSVVERLDSDRRLSRELEEGFRDDSDEENTTSSNNRRTVITS